MIDLSIDWCTHTDADDTDLGYDELDGAQLGHTLFSQTIKETIYVTVSVSSK